MKPALHFFLAPSAFAFLFAAALLPASAGCGGTNAGTGAAGTSSTRASSTGAGGGAGGDVGTGGTAACHLDPPGDMFSFLVQNTGTQMLRLAYGCSASLPIVLVTPEGTLGIGPGPADACEFACETVYKGMAATACSDCGGGYGADLAPGATVTITWDRRVYKEITVDPACVAGPSATGCALGETVAKEMAQKGKLTVCTDATVGQAGYCSTSKTVSFTLDTTQSSGTITVM